MNQKYFPWIIIGLALMLTFSIWQNFHQGKTISGLESGQKIINEKLEEDKAFNFQSIDSLIKQDRKEETEKILLEISKILPTINKTPRYDKNIDRYRNADSISELFTKHYPDNP